MSITYQKQWQFLRKTVELGKVAHAYLFYGQDPIGKKRVALEFIKLIDCQNENFEKRPCQICSSCQSIEKMANPDLFLVEPQDREIKISQIRELHSHLSLRSYLAPFKSIIVDQAHCLNQEAQSAFLKLLEEPKGKTLFILISEYPKMLLPTILSRVERLRFYSSSLKPKIDGVYQKKIIAEILKISRQDLVDRFRYAKELSEDPQNLKKILDIWLEYFREELISGVINQSKDYSLTKLRKILKLLQTISFLISTTNVNPRLALEILMLEL